MNKEHELARLYEDRDILEGDREFYNEKLRFMEMAGIGEEDDEYNSLFYEVNSIDNELMYIEKCIDDLES